MRKRYLAAVPLAAVLFVGPALAAPGIAAGKPTAVTLKKGASAKPTAKPVPKQSAKPAKPTKPAKPAKPTKPAKPVQFGVTGTLTGVDLTAATLTLLVKGGKGGKEARGTSQTVAVATTARITLDDVPSTLGSLPVGVHVAVTGTVTGTLRTAAKVSAESDELPEQPEQPEPSPSETVTAPTA